MPPEAVILEKYCSACKQTFGPETSACPQHGATLKPFLLDQKFRLVERLGDGRSGEVYRGLHVLTGEEWAIKLPKTAAAPGESKSRGNKRLLREARNSAKVRNRHVARVIDAAFCQVTGQFYLVMELARGINLKEFLQRNPEGLDARVSMVIFNQLCDGVAAIHDQGIVHRDLSPENVMLVNGDFNRIKIIDFEFAKDIFRISQARTIPGTLIGSPRYMAPEQWDADRIHDARADVFSLGLILFELLAGRLPDEKMIQNIGDLELHRKNFSSEFHELRRVAPEEVTDAVLRVVHKALQNKRERRYQDVREFHKAYNLAISGREVEEESEVTPERLQIIRELPTGLILIRAEQTGIEILVDGKSIGVSRMAGEYFRVADLPAGATVEISGWVKGRDPFVRRVTVEPDREVLVSIRSGPLLEYRNAAGIELVLIPNGRFLMGSEPSDEERWSHTVFEKYGRKADFGRERPSRFVTISRPFYLGRCQVTQAQWRYVAESLPRIKRPLNPDPSFFKGRDLPVESVSWEDCQEFVHRLNRLEDGNRYGLPTEAQWEYGCRAGTKGDYAGDLDAMGWYAANSGTTRINAYDAFYVTDEQDLRLYLERTLAPNGCQTHPVGQKLSNGFGLFDMHGNVLEWCADWFGENYYAEAPAIDPTGPTEGRLRVARGGAWNTRGNRCRSAFRGRLNPRVRFNYVGLRLMAHPMKQ